MKTPLKLMLLAMVMLSLCIVEFACHPPKAINYGTIDYRYNPATGDLEVANYTPPTKRQERRNAKIDPNWNKPQKMSDMLGKYAGTDTAFARNYKLMVECLDGMERNSNSADSFDYWATRCDSIMLVVDPSHKPIHTPLKASL